MHDSHSRGHFGRGRAGAHQGATARTPGLVAARNWSCPASRSHVVRRRPCGSPGIHVWRVLLCAKGAGCVGRIARTSPETCSSGRSELPSFIDFDRCLRRLMRRRLRSTFLVAVMAVVPIAAPQVANGQLNAGGQTIGGPGVVELKEKPAGAEGMATVLVSENPLTVCATVRPIKGIVSGIYLGAGDEEGHFDIAPSGDVTSRTATVCRPSTAWVSVHCRGACSFEWRVDQLH
jgi:hypothetical protein